MYHVITKVTQNKTEVLQQFKLFIFLILNFKKYYFKLIIIVIKSIQQFTYQDELRKLNILPL